MKEIITQLFKRDEGLANAEGPMDDATRAMKMRAIVRNAMADEVLSLLSPSKDGEDNQKE